MARLAIPHDLLGNAKNNTYPVLVIRGDQEPKENYPAEEFTKTAQGRARSPSSPNCDHSYVGAEGRFSTIVTE